MVDRTFLCVRFGTRFASCLIIDATNTTRTHRPLNRVIVFGDQSCCFGDARKYCAWSDVWPACRPPSHRNGRSSRRCRKNIRGFRGLSKKILRRSHRHCCPRRRLLSPKAVRSFLANITCIAWKVVYYGRRDVTWSACVLDCRACRCALQKRMNRSRCLLGGGRLANGPNESCIVGLHIGTIWQIRRNDRCVAAMRAVATLERFIFKNITLY